MTQLKHYVGKTEYASIVEVLQELDAARRLGYSNDNYTGTAVYAAVNASKHKLGDGVTLGNTHYYEKSNIVSVVNAYIDRKTKRISDIQNMRTVIQFIRSNPEAATKMLDLIK